MKVVIFAGGLGTRLAEETEVQDTYKPMCRNFGGKPVPTVCSFSTHSSFGFNEFVICLGYKGYFITEYFVQYYLHNSDITIELKSNKMDVHYTDAESFTVTLVDTGLNAANCRAVKKNTALYW